MKMTKELQTSLERLNPDQQQAVESIDGPLLVIAGPGTGKTQILSLRAASILIERDVTPDQILCLTYTEAGAEAMRKRLVELIGREGYDIHVSTFHGFASSLRSRFPEYFTRSESANVVTELRQHRIVNDILKQLDASSPLSGSTIDGVSTRLSDALSFISNFKRSGLTTDEFRAIQKQTQESLAYLTEHSSLLDLASTTLPRSVPQKEAFVEEFEAEVERTIAMAPHALKQPVISTPGIYLPYLIWLRDLVRTTELLDEDGKLTGYKQIESALFQGTKREGKTFAGADLCEKAFVWADIYDAYDHALVEHNLYDFDDMISEALEALTEHPSLRHELQERYQYIQVDEFQDTNGSQMRLIELLIEGIDKPNVMVVGDDDQAIMRFQGASVAYIEQFIERYHPRRIVLKTNYRSTPALVDLGKQIATQIETRLGDSVNEKNIRSFQSVNDQEIFIHTQFASPDIEYFALAKDIRRRLDDGFMATCSDAEESIAVIASKHASLKHLMPALRYFNIPFTYSYTADVFQMESMQYLLSVMRFVAAYAQGKATLAVSYLPEIIASKETGLTHSQAVAFALYAKEQHDWFAALETFDNPRLNELHASLLSWAALAPQAPLRELIFSLAQPSLAYYRSMRDENPLLAAEFNGGIRALIAFAEGEIENAQPFKHALRLPEFVDMFDSLKRFGVTIDATIELGQPEAIRLTSAHSSKGLQFDLVYLLDSDDETWHRSSNRPSPFAGNLLIDNRKNDDDIRRLLFVAITRAKRQLEIFSGRGNVVRELQEYLETSQEETVPEELDAIIETSWRAHFALDTPELLELIQSHIPPALSATALNTFVHYQEGCINSSTFPEARILKLPETPHITMEFGTHVHAFLQDYVTKRHTKTFDLDDLARQHRQAILWMDFDPDDLQSYARRFDRIVNAFIPFLNEQLHGRILSETKLETLMDGMVPLYGIIDLMLINDDTQTIELIDFKTGLSYQENQDSTDYERQLLFYKLLVESQPAFKGYEVVRCSDVYVEPERGTAGTIHEPAVVEMTGADQSHLKQLIKAMWSRIEYGDFDTTAFETSDEYHEAELHNITKEGKPRKRKDRKLFQEAYERWLINNDPTKS